MLKPHAIAAKRATSSQAAVSTNASVGSEASATASAGGTFLFVSQQAAASAPFQHNLSIFRNHFPAI
jgi:hypothetical protein